MAQVSGQVQIHGTTYRYWGSANSGMRCCKKAPGRRKSHLEEGLWKYNVISIEMAFTRLANFMLLQMWPLSPAPVAQMALISPIIYMAIFPATKRKAWVCFFSNHKPLKHKFLVRTEASPLWPHLMFSTGPWPWEPTITSSNSDQVSRMPMPIVLADSPSHSLPTLCFYPSKHHPLLCPHQNMDRLRPNSLKFVTVSPSAGQTPQNQTYTHFNR